MILFNENDESKNLNSLLNNSTFCPDDVDAFEVAFTNSNEFPVIYFFLWTLSNIYLKSFHKWQIHLKMGNLETLIDQLKLKKRNLSRDIYKDYIIKKMYVMMSFE